MICVWSVTFFFSHFLGSTQRGRAHWVWFGKKVGGNEQAGGPPKLHNLDPIFLRLFRQVVQSEFQFDPKGDRLLALS